MQRRRGRTITACYYCHSQKVKCTGEQPCTKCRSGNRQCVFPPRKQASTGPMDATSAPACIVNQSATETPLFATTQPTTFPHDSHDRAMGASPIASSVIEHFCEQLQNVYSAPFDPLGDPSPSLRGQTDKSVKSRYTYLPLKVDNLHRRVALELPPYHYAIHLVDRFETFLGSDYHWYLRKKFRARLEKTYQDLTSQAIDRNWLCRLSVVLALGESFGERAPSLVLDGENISPQEALSSNATARAPTVPGHELFEQALLLFDLPFEEPTVEHVESLNLIAFYCYSLNRRKTAYTYAGMSIRFANMLGLAQLRRLAESDVEYEHRKRVWWTCYCMDLMTSTELGLNPAQDVDARVPEYPESVRLSAESSEEFFESIYLTAQSRICLAKYKVLQASFRLDGGFSTDSLSVVEPCLAMLDDWRATFPLQLSLGENFSPGNLQMPALRTIASLLLRFHQCFILLLRPLLLHNLSCFVRGDRPPTAAPLQWINKSIDAATCNAKILIALWGCNRIAKFGFWESLHLFSALLVLSIANLMGVNDGTSPYQSVDVDVYGKARALLKEMAACGNAAARDHESMLANVEALSSFSSSLLPSQTGANSARPFTVDDWTMLFDGSEADEAALDFLANWSRSNNMSGQ